MRHANTSKCYNKMPPTATDTDVANFCRGRDLLPISILNFFFFFLILDERDFLGMMFLQPKEERSISM